MNKKVKPANAHAVPDIFKVSVNHGYRVMQRNA